MGALLLILCTVATTPSTITDSASNATVTPAPSSKKIECYKYQDPSSQGGGRGEDKSYSPSTEGLKKVSCDDACVKTRKYRVQRKYEFHGGCDDDSVCKDEVETTTIEGSGLEKSTEVFCCYENVCNMSPGHPQTFLQFGAATALAIALARGGVVC